MRRLALPSLILAAIGFAVWLSPLAPLSFMPSWSSAQITCGGVTYTFVDGTIAEATQVNANFQSLVNCINAGNLSTLPQTATNFTLKALTGGRFPLVYRQGSAAIGDGGGASYVWSPAATCTDDAGACIQPNVGSGRWLLIPTYPLNKMVWGIAGVPIFLVSTTGSDESGLNFCLVSPCLTINQAAKAFYQFPWYGTTELVSIGAGTYNETISISSPLITAPGVTGTAIPALYLKGAGSGSTAITGAGVECATIASSFGGTAVSLQGLTLSGTATACQSTLFAQEGGIINVFQDVNLGAASQQQLHSEETGSQIAIWGSPTVSGSAAIFAATTTGGLIYTNPANFAAPSGVTITFQTPTYSNETILGQHGGRFHLSDDTVFSGSTTGRAYVVEDGGAIDSDNPNRTPIPGTIKGIVLPGGIIFPETNLISVANQSAVSASSGIGTTGTASVSNDDSQGMFVTLSPAGSSIGSTGSFSVTLSSGRQSNAGNTVPCSATPNNLTGAWDTGATFLVNPGTNISPIPTLQVIWKNGSTALTAGSTYGVGIICQ